MIASDFDRFGRPKHRIKLREDPIVISIGCVAGVAGFGRKLAGCLVIGKRLVPPGKISPVARLILEPLAVLDCDFQPRIFTHEEATATRFDGRAIGRIFAVIRLAFMSAHQCEFFDYLGAIAKLARFLVMVVRYRVDVDSVKLREICISAIQFMCRERCANEHPLAPVSVVRTFGTARGVN